MKKVNFWDMMSIIYQSFKENHKIPKFYIMRKGEELSQITGINLKDSTLIDSNGYTISATLSSQLEIYQYTGE